MSLLILTFSYRYRKLNLFGFEKLKFIPKPVIIGICSFAFIATTLPRESGKLNLKSDYEIQIDISKDSLITKISETYEINNDSKYRTIIVIPEKRSRIMVSMIISDLENDRVNIKLDSILSYVTLSSGFFSGVKKKNVEYVKSLKLEDFEQLFIEQKINELNKK